jgi:hypothetical protein
LPHAVLVEIIESWRDNKAKGACCSANAEQRQQTFWKLVSLRPAARVRCLPSLIDLLGGFGLCQTGERPLPSDGR